MRNVPTNKIILVVINENTLGYIDHIVPNTANVLHASILKGGVHSCPKQLNSDDKIRLANEADFHEYRVSHIGYWKDPDYVHA